MKDVRRTIPAVSEILHACMEQTWSERFSREQILTAIRSSLTEIRKQLTGASGDIPPLQAILDGIRLKAESESAYSLKRVINATGVIVHTNLGRAPFSREAVLHLQEITQGYSNLELDLDSGQRGSRDQHLEKILHQLIGAEASLIVNNNAAALLLLLNTMAEGREVIVSRGELIEIGGSFRLPEIMKKSGAILKEVGSTNKTRVSDYKNAITEQTGMILVVHPSNYQIIGFTEKPALEKLIQIGKEKGIPVVEDQGSGILVGLEDYGISGEPTVQERLQSGLDLICFSGDKILGGSQAGFVCGKKTLIEKLRSNPLFRALRLDKTAYAVLEATLQLYRRGQADQIPVIRMISCSFDDLLQRATDWIARLRELLPRENFGWEETANYIGGGVAPMKHLRSVAVSVASARMSAHELAASLRNENPPVLSRIESDRLLLELRTITEEEQNIIQESLLKICSVQPE